MVAQLENIEGNLRDAYLQTRKGTALHMDSLITERRTNPALRPLSFYTPDGQVYRLDKQGRPQWLFIREHTNPFFQDIGVFYQQLVGEGNYHPTEEQVQHALRARTTLVTYMDELQLKRLDDNQYSLEVPTEGYDDILNTAGRKVAERVFDEGDDFIQNMKMLHDEGKINVSRVYVLNPDYVEREAKKGGVGRGSWVCNFSDNSSAVVDLRIINIHNRLRGVRQRVAAKQQTNFFSPAAQSPLEIRTAIMEEILDLSRNYVAPKLWNDYETHVRRKIAVK